MTRISRIPPGRAGRLWLRRRIGTAERGRDQLERKLRILVPELQRRRIKAERHRADWAAARRDADTWLLRAVLLGGQDAVRNASAPRPVTVLLHVETSMGLSYPVDATLSPPVQSPYLPGSTAVVHAGEAHRTALLAGVRTAAAEEAVRRVETETVTTRRRLRGLEKRWLPELQQALAALELSLEQAEQEDNMRLRTGVTSSTDRRRAP